MRGLYLTLIVISGILSLLIVGLAMFQVFGGGFNVLLPGLGLIIGLPFIILLLAVFDAALIAVALLIRRSNFRKLD